MSIAQVMMAIFKQNPNAFMKNNINLIRVGQTLQIPSESEMASTSPSAAQQELRAQMEEWQEYQGNLSSPSRVAKAETADAGPEMSAAEPDTDSSAPSAEKEDADIALTVEAESSSSEQDVLEIVRAKVDATDSAGSGASAADLAEYEAAIKTYKENVGMLEESLASSELEKQDLSERVALLEQQIDKANKLIDMQNADLARLQAAEQAGEVSPVVPIDVAEEADDSATEADTLSVSGTAEEPPIATDASPLTVVDTTPGMTAPSAPEVAPVAAPAPEVKKADVKQPEVAEKPPVAEKKASKTRVRPAAPAEEKSFMDSAMDFITSSWMTMLGTALAVLLILVGLIVVLRRRRSIAEFEDSIISGTAVLDISTAESTEPTESGSETSFLSDFVPGMGNMQADEVDPLAEAEVYMAYGRDEQAEEVLKEAASKNPDRHELKLKLLEIYQTRKDISSFETLAEELYPADGNIPMAVWVKVAEMGKIVNPENPLFQGEIKLQEDTLFGDKDRKDDVQLSDLLDTDTVDTEEAETVDTEEAKLMQALNEDIEEGDNEEVVVEDVAEELAEELTEEIADTEILKAAEEEQSTDEDSDSKVEDFPVPEEEVLDLDLGDFTPDEHQETDSFDLDSLGVNLEDLDQLDEDTEESEAIVEGEMDFNLDGIDLDLGDTAETEESALDMSELEAIEGIDLDLESDDDTSEMSMQDETLEFADLGDLTLTDVESDSAIEEDSEIDDDEMPAGANETWDEAGTKLDLARAYIEMDDKESAQSILEEVAKEGTDDQKNEARDLLNQINAG
jgi:pilus assembly protein FimV